MPLSPEAMAPRSNGRAIPRTSSLGPLVGTQRSGTLARGRQRQLHGSGTMSKCGVLSLRVPDRH
eukprot:3796949-Lingulodinium_polyedra.AAC.1